MRCPACKGAGFKLPDEGINVFGGLLVCASCNGAGVVDAESNDEPVTRLERIVCAMIRTGAFYHPDNEEFAPQLVLKAAAICDFMRKVELNQQFGKLAVSQDKYE